MSEQSEEFATTLRNQLREGEGELDSRTRARLAAARREAIERDGIAESDNRWSLSIGRPAWGTVAVVLIVAAMVNIPWQTEQPLPQPAEQMTGQLVVENGEQPAPEEDEQLELYENLELLEFYEDMEFYEWLADAELEEMAS